MCGLTVVVDRSGHNQLWLERLRADRSSLRHRGPDDTAAVSISPYAVMRAWRLGVRNRSSGGQPLTFPDGSVLVANGECYGAAFRSEAARSDLEALYTAYRDGGAEALVGLDGMFAGVLYFAPAKRFIAFRDRLGIKPLFIWNLRGGSIISSEIKGMVAVTGETPSFDRDFVTECMVFGHSLSRGQTPYAGIRHVEPGEALEIGQAGRSLLGQGGASADRFISERGEFSDWEQELEKAVTSTCVADASPAVLLSGGVDSSLIADCATRSNHQWVGGAATARFPNARPEDVSRDESAYAAEVAECCDLPILCFEVEGPREPAELEPVFNALEQPMFNSSMVVTYELGKRLAEHGIRCVLTGDGLDELRLAYERLRTRVVGAPELDHVAPYADDLVPLPRLFYRDIAADEIAGAFQLRAETVMGALPARPRLAEALRDLELDARLPNYHLTRVDRLLMAHGVEGRVPFLRRDPVAIAMGAPTEAVLCSPAKSEERRILARRFGPNIVQRPKARFSGPLHSWVGAWFARGSPEEYIRDSDRVRQLTRQAGVASLFTDIKTLDLNAERSLAVWGLACVASWEASERRWAQER